MAIDPGQTWHTYLNFTAVCSTKTGHRVVLKPQNTCETPHTTEAKQISDDFIANATKLKSSNAAIAAGLKQYGYHEEANRVTEEFFVAASYFEAGRMPELFGGIERQNDRFPVPYPDANIPQAWAAGSIFLLIRTILGLQANAPQHHLAVQPVLPDWLT